MSLATVSLVPALPCQQLNVDPRLGGKVEPIIQMNNNSISSTNLTPADTYTMKVLRSSDPQSGHLFHEHTDGVTGNKTVFLQYDKTQKHLSVPQAQKFLSPNHDVTGNLAVSGNATILGNLTVNGSFTPSFTSIASLDVANLRNTNLTSLNANINSLIGVNANISNLTTVNLQTQNFISNTLISNLTVDNLFAQDGVFTNLTCLNPIVDLQSSNLTVLNNLQTFGLTVLDDVKLPLINAEFLKTSNQGFIQSGSFASVQVGTALTALDALACSGNAATATLAATATNALACSGNAATATLAATATNALACSGNAATATLAATATNALACSGNAATATLATTATNALNIPKYDRVWFCTHDALLTGAGTVANPISFVGALAAAKAYNTLNPESYQIIQLAPGAYGFGGTVFTLDCSRITIQGLGGYKSVQLVEGLDVNVNATFDATNENITLENLAIFNQATAGVPAVNFEPSARCYLRMNNCFVLADTGNQHAIDCNPSAAGSRLYIDNCEILQAAGNNAEVIHVRKGELWQLSNSTVTGRHTAPVLRVSNSGSAVGAVNNTVVSSDYAVVNAQNVVQYDIAGNLIMTNAAVLASSVNTSATGVNLTNAAGNLIISNCQFGIYGAVGKAIQAAGGNLISNTNNALGSALLGNNVSTAGFAATVNQTLI